MFRPQPEQVMTTDSCISFGMFVVVLVLVGSGILLHIPNVFVWKLHPTS
jgi:hypothetical protein